MTPSLPQSTDAQRSETDKPQDPLLEALKGPLSKLITDDVRLAIDPEKIFQYAEIRRNEFYWRGNQYLDEVYSSDGNLVDYKPINGTWHEFQNTDDDASGMYSTVINDFRGYGRKFVAVLAQQAPNVKCEPNDDQNTEQRDRAKKAQRVADLLHNLWDVKKQNRKLFLTYYKDGPAFGHTFFVSDGEKYGYTEEPVTEMRPMPLGPATLNCVSCGVQTPVPDTTQPPTTCPNCQQPFGPEDLQEPETANMPQPTGEVKRYANGCVEHRVESGLRVTTVFDIEDLTDTPFLLWESEVHKGKIFQEFPWLRDKFANEGGESYGGGGTSTTSGQITRDIASSPSGTYIAPRKNRLLASKCWIRPTMYELAKGTVTVPTQDGQQQSMDFRDALKQNFPQGLKVTLISGDTIAKLEAERMDDAWSLSPPEPAETAYADPLCKDYLDVQDQTNDFANIQRQTWERAIPQVFIDTRRIDTTFQAKYRQLPASYIPVQGTGSGGNINDAIGKVPTATPEEGMEKYGVEQREHGAEIIGITPQIYGGGAAEQTAYATNLKRNQAMLQLSVPADSAREYWCDVTYNAVMLAAKHSKGRIPDPNAPSTGVVFIDEIEDLLKGGFHFEAGDAMPMSWPEQREQLNENLKNLAGSPQVLNQLGFNEPSNIPKLQDTLLGMPEWKIPNQEALGKVDRSIQQLLQTGPTEKPSQMNPGQTIQIPSIPVDEWDDHAFFAQAIGEWLSSEKADLQRQQNPQGFSNVVAFWKSHKGLATPPPMPPGAPGQPPPPGPQAQ